MDNQMKHLTLGSTKSDTRKTTLYSNSTWVFGSRESPFPQVKYPKFNGEDLKGWLLKLEQYIVVAWVANHHTVKVVMLNLERTCPSMAPVLCQKYKGVWIILYELLGSNEGLVHSKRIWWSYGRVGQPKTIWYHWSLPWGICRYTQLTPTWGHLCVKYLC